MLTAATQSKIELAGLDHGADDYLTKPFEFRELLARHSRPCCGVPVSFAREINVADLVLDTSAQSVSRAGRSVDAHGEGVPLWNPCAAMRRVVGRAEIAEHVWDGKTLIHFQT